jgi:hypothetical protein
VHTLSITVNYIGQQVESLKSNSGSEEGILPYFSVEQVRAFRCIFGFLNDKDRDILYLIFVSRKKQKDVQRIIGRSQTCLVYDIKRIRQRLKYIFYIHSVFDIFLKFVEEKVDVFTPEEIGILTMMFYTSSFTMTAETMGISQVRTRYAYNKCLKRMEMMEMWEPYEIFMTVRENLNAIRRVYKGDSDGLKTLKIL